MNSKDVIGQEGGVDEKPRCSAALYDWSCSPLARIALEGEEDAAAAEMDGLLKKVRQHNDGGSEEVLLRAYYPLALRLLGQLHRDLRCPAELHRAFHAGYCHPSAFNFAVILSRIFTLFDSRIILLELIRAATGIHQAICYLLSVSLQVSPYVSISPSLHAYASGCLPISVYDCFSLCLPLCLF
jgi:hypothetical protein